MKISRAHRVDVRSLGYETDKDSGIILGLSKVNITPSQPTQGKLRGICIPFEIDSEAISLYSEDVNEVLIISDRTDLKNAISFPNEQSLLKTFLNSENIIYLPPAL